MAPTPLTGRPDDTLDALLQGVAGVLAPAKARLRRVRHGTGPVLLELEVTRGLLEAPPATPVDALRSIRTPTLRGVVRAIEQAAEDDDVVGLVAHLGGEIGYASAAELRAAVTTFRAAGKRTVAWAETFGEMGPGNSSYHLATGFEQIWIQPTGDLGLIGAVAGALFLRGALDKLGVESQIGARHEYKTAANLFLEEGMTEPQREMMTRLVESITEDVVADIAAARGLGAAEVRALVDTAPIGASDALGAGLVDRVGYRDEVYADLRAELTGDGDDVRLLFVDRYDQSGGPLAGLTSAARHLPGVGRGDRGVVAVIGAHGPIHLGRSGTGRAPLRGGHSAGSDSVSAALRAAAGDDRVRAVVLRIDSPGGSAVASDAIRRAVLATRGSGTPVVASMASMAASGGYYIAMPCDRILANRATLTGSIGVLAGKQVLGGALERIGVRREWVGSGRFSDMFLPDRRFDEEEWARLDDWLDRVYDDFTGKAAEDRGMPLDQLRDVAKGRVWTGADAAAIGLVDELGGLSAAVDAACGLAGTDRAAVDVRPWPKPQPLSFLSPPENSEAPAAYVAGDPFALVGEGVGPVDRLLRLLSAELGRPVPGVLTLPWPIELR
jgi:protease-4